MYESYVLQKNHFLWNKIQLVGLIEEHFLDIGPTKDQMTNSKQF